MAKEEYVLWHYTPSVPGNLALAAIFGILTIVHLFFLIKRRWWFCIPLVLGGLFEVIGYVGRYMAHDKLHTVIYYAMQSLLILLAPILFAATVYMFLGRIIVGVPNGARYCIIPVRFLTKIFVLGDVTCFLIQGAGGGLLSNAKTQKNVDLGENVILAGLIFQIVIFAIFCVVAIIFHVRAKKAHSYVAASGNSGDVAQIPWQHLLFGLYTVSGMITIRNVVRAAEYAMGSDGYLLSHEWTIFMFDGAMMALVLICFVPWYTTNVGVHHKNSDSESSTAIRMDEPKHNSYV